MYVNQVKNTKIKIKFLPEEDNLDLSRVRYKNKYYLYIYKYGLGGSRRLCTLVIELA